VKLFIFWCTLHCPILPYRTTSSWLNG
jgi:hypothetical protein